MKAVIYARFSSDLQREESIEAQVRACSDYIANKKWVLTNTYIDRAISARSDQRPEFQRMIADAKLHKFDFVVIHKLDRFSRDRYDHAFYKRELKLAGVRLISVLENLDDSPESVVLESVLEGFSEYYSRNLGREVMKGLKENALQCKHTGGVPPLGYDVGADGKYIINDREAVAVRYIFEAYLSGDGYDSIARWLSTNGIRGKRGGVIAKNSLHDILCNEKYTGTFVYNRSTAKDAAGRRNGHSNKSNDEIIRIEGGIPAIITKEIYNKAMDKMQKNKSGTHRAKEPYLLSGILFCGKCDSAMVGSSRGNPRTPTEITKKYYQCNRKGRTHECDCQAVNRDVIENVVLTYLEKIADSKTIGDICTWVSENVKLYKKTSADKLKEVKKELAAVSRDVEKLLDKIIDGLDSEAARQRLAGLEARKLHLEVQVTDLQVFAETTTGATKAEIKKYLSQLKKIKSLTREQQAAVIKQFVSRIEYYPPDGGGKDPERSCKITTHLDSLLAWCEDREGHTPSPPLLSSRLPWWIQKKATF